MCCFSPFPYNLFFSYVDVLCQRGDCRSKILETSAHFFSFTSANGACRHIVAALFDMEATITRNELENFTSVSCLRVKRKRITENAVPMKYVEFQKSEYGKISKD